jgi:hypothetical protein
LDGGPGSDQRPGELALRAGEALFRPEFRENDVENNNEESNNEENNNDESDNS